MDTGWSCGIPSSFVQSVASQDQNQHMLDKKTNFWSAVNIVTENKNLRFLDAM